MAQSVETTTTPKAPVKKVNKTPRRRLPAATLDQLQEAFQRQRGVDNYWLERKAERKGQPLDETEAVIGTFKRWSSSAVECYLRNAQCDGCYYKQFFTEKAYGCKMDLAVEQLLETHGKPSRSLLARHA